MYPSSDVDGAIQKVIQAEYHQQLFSILIPTLEAPESRSVYQLNTSSIPPTLTLTYPTHHLRPKKQSARPRRGRAHQLLRGRRARHASPTSTLSSSASSSFSIPRACQPMGRERGMRMGATIESSRKLSRCRGAPAVFRQRPKSK